ncbi:MAG: sulfite exporter TauE/SafE family protein [Gemmobacter sp.]
MAELAAAVLALPGLGWLILAAALAGLVRGFSGFGSGLVFMPIAGAVLSPAQAVAVLVVTDLIGPLPNLPGAWRNGQPSEMARLAAGMLVGLPLGLAILFVISAEAFRWGVGLLALGTVALLVTGWRWRGGRGTGMTVGAGFASGIVGGASGLAGPPVILYYLASPLGIGAVRANLMMFLVLVDLGMVVALSATGRMGWLELALGLGLLVPFSLANWVGSHLFHPDRARAYRIASYLLIGVSALAGLPVWGGG